MYYTKIKFTMIILSIISCCSCKSLSSKNVQTEFEPVVDILIFTNNEQSIKGKYSITEEFIKDEIFVLKNNGDIFFEGNYALKDYLYEVFKDRYLFITPMQKRNNLASPFLTSRDSVLLYDLQEKGLYNFNANGFLIQAFKEKYPVRSTETINEQKSNGFKLNATYDSVNIETNELFLLLEDLKTIEIIKLKEVD